jgi:hypothetical protein
MRSFRNDWIFYAPWSRIMTSHFNKEILAMIAAVAVCFSIAGCATMGEQFVANDFPSDRTLFLRPGVFDVYGGEETPNWTSVEKIWLEKVMIETVNAGFKPEPVRENASVEMVLRAGMVDDQTVMGMRLVSWGFRMELIDVKSGKLLLNQWEKKLVNGNGKYVGDAEMGKFLREFTKKTLAAIPSK